MENDTAHSLKEFHNFPWNKLTAAFEYREKLNRGEDTEFQIGGISRRGITANIDFNPRRPHIDFLRKDASADAWEIPESLADLVDEYYLRGQDNKEQEIKTKISNILDILGITND